MKTTIYEVIEQMDKHLRTDLLKKDGAVQKEKLWDNTYIKHQIDKRRNGGSFSVSDHIRAMVYAMLSSGISWSRVAKDIDMNTKCIVSIDEVFCGYNTDQLLRCTPEQLRKVGKKKIYSAFSNVKSCKVKK